MTRRNGCTIYVGNLPGDIREREVDDLFYKVSGWLDRVYRASGPIYRASRRMLDRWGRCCGVSQACEYDMGRLGECWE
jgi:hypothetical protein